MKRVCIVLPDHWAANFGGAEYQTKVLVEALVARGDYEISYLARNVSSAFVPAGYRIQRIKTCHRLTRYADFFDLPGLYALLVRARPELIFQTVGCAYTGACALYARRARIRMVWQVASDVDVEPLEVKWSRNYPFRYLEKRILEYGVRHSSAVIVQTKKQAELLRRHYGRQADAIIPNFHPRPTEVIHKSDEAVVVWIANLKPLKRPEIFVRLARDLQSGSHGARFVLIGRGGTSDWHRQVLAEISRTPAVDYLGERTQDEVNEVLAKASIFVNTSEYEGFPNTFIQAWARKVPVVSLCVDPDGVIQENNIGFVSGTYEKLREDVSRLIDDAKLRSDMADRAANFAGNNYSEKNLEAILRILNE